ncbi:MAG: hypothetical protein COW47_01405 [Candidatus Huberarchaeum crystalense]|uniref:Uncharacterized protein n=1 Tax=Huberarchaeum crystalense TaxID=2014257 RepID=A0A2G9LJG5_HUBC1|nr:hypothetical protein [archaeon]OIP20656.1 MAG: hypothetical protein AUJ91_00760 [archaeon CG2_30_31_98]PIN66679.1 MAG: hypothetical protein COW69_00915 [Candidatus Huberarchaeum crystalense]NCS98183.1 hypothetical protein [archaeon]PIV13683.1 MAG: hypothetical protein COS45_01615 [Candidatus Huberarchaeum crystalense]
MAVELSITQIGLIILTILGGILILYYVGSWFATIISGEKLIEVFLLFIDGFVQLGQKLGGLVGWIGQVFK